MIIGIPVFFIAILHAKDQTSPSPKISSAFESFGIQRFEEKKESIPFSLKDLNGNQVSLSDYKGKPVLLFFWATWCTSCKEDIVLIRKIFRREERSIDDLTLPLMVRRRRVRKVVKKIRSLSLSF